MVDSIDAYFTEADGQSQDIINISDLADVPGEMTDEGISPALAVSYVRSSGSLDTREYDFSYLIPYLTNPKTWHLFDAKIVLIVPEVSYTLAWRTCAFTAALRQLVLIDISGKGHHGGAPVPAVTRKTRGGTAIALRADYLL